MPLASGPDRPTSGRGRASTPARTAGDAGRATDYVIRREAGWSASRHAPDRRGTARRQDAGAPRPGGDDGQAPHVAGAVVVGRTLRRPSMPLRFVPRHPASEMEACARAHHRTRSGALRRRMRIIPPSSASASRTRRAPNASRRLPDRISWEIASACTIAPSTRRRSVASTEDVGRGLDDAPRRLRRAGVGLQRSTEEDGQAIRAGYTAPCRHGIVGMLDVDRASRRRDDLRLPCSGPSRRGRACAAATGALPSPRRAIGMQPISVIPVANATRPTRPGLRATRPTGPAARPCRPTDVLLDDHAVGTDDGARTRPRLRRRPAALLVPVARCLWVSPGHAEESRAQAALVRRRGKTGRRRGDQRADNEPMERSQRMRHRSEGRGRTPSPADARHVPRMPGGPIPAASPAISPSRRGKPSTGS